MLAVVWAAERFQLYVNGIKFHIITDHKPLIGIFESNKPTSTRIDRRKLRPMPYNCQLSCRRGRNEENPADFIIRHPNVSEVEEQNLAEEYPNYVCMNAIPKAMTIQEVEAETQKDPNNASLDKSHGNQQLVSPRSSGIYKDQARIDSSQRTNIEMKSPFDTSYVEKQSCLSSAHRAPSYCEDKEASKGESLVSWCI